MLICRVCQEEKEDEMFKLDNRRGTRYVICKKCQNKQAKEHYKAIKLGEIVKPKKAHPLTQVCTTCNIEKPIYDFEYLEVQDWYRKECRECGNKPTERQKLLTQGKKVCKICGQIKFLQNFAPNRRICLDCFGHKILPPEEISRRRKNKLLTDSKICARCHTEKPLTDYYTQSYCVQCSRDISNEKRVRHTPKTSARIKHNTEQHELLLQGKKKCGGCLEIKDLAEFYRNTGRNTKTVSGYGYCKKCMSSLILWDQIKKQRESFLAKTLEYINKEYTCEVCAETKAVWEFPNEERYRNICSKCREVAAKKRLMLGKLRKHKERKKTDPAYRISCKLSNNIRQALRGKKHGSYKSYIGCSLEFFKDWIEKQFVPEMSWDNYSEWHIDHYVPQAYFTEKDLKVCWNYRNLRPLWAKDNTDKGDTLPADYKEFLDRVRKEIA